MESFQVICKIIYVVTSSKMSPFDFFGNGRNDRSFGIEKSDLIHIAASVAGVESVAP
jgi:hypothetical protein